MSDSGSTIWDWVRGPHPTMKLIGYGILTIGGLYAVVRYVHWLPAAMFALMLLLAWGLYRNMFFEGDGVRAIVFTDKPDVIDLKHIGVKKFEELKKDGSPQPISTSKGAPLYAFEELKKDTARFGWIHAISRLEFIRKSVTYLIAKDVAEDMLQENFAIRDVPRIIGDVRSQQSIRVYEGDIDRSVFTLDPSSSEASEAIRKMDELKDPLHRIMEIAEKHERTQEAAGEDV